MSYTTINIHLGEGAEGRFRKEALEQLARNADHFWAGEASIGRWLCELADVERAKHEITVANYRRSKKFGWGWSTNPTGEGTSIELPGEPMYEGTLGQLAAARDDDRTFNNLGGAFYNTAQFYNGRRITHTWTFTKTKSACDLPFDPDADDYNDWSQRNSDHHWENDEYGWAWVAGFDPPPDSTNIKIRVE